MTQTRFRLAIILSILPALVGLAVAVGGATVLPAQLQEYLEHERTRDPKLLDWILLVSTVPLMAAGIASFVGFLRFSWWSRPLWIAVSLVGYAVLPLFGPTVELGAVTALYHLSSVLGGVILGISYASPVASEWFRRPAPPNQRLHPMAAAGR